MKKCRFCGQEEKDGRVEVAWRCCESCLGKLMAKNPGSLTPPSKRKEGAVK